MKWKFTLLLLLLGLSSVCSSLSSGQTGGDRFRQIVTNTTHFTMIVERTQADGTVTRYELAPGASLEIADPYGVAGDRPSSIRLYLKATIAGNDEEIEVMQDAGPQWGIYPQRDAAGALLGGWEGIRFVFVDPADLRDKYAVFMTPEEIRQSIDVLKADNHMGTITAIGQGTITATGVANDYFDWAKSEFAAEAERFNFLRFPLADFAVPAGAVPDFVNPLLVGVAGGAQWNLAAEAALLPWWQNMRDAITVFFVFLMMWTVWSRGIMQLMDGGE